MISEGFILRTWLGAVWANLRAQFDEGFELADGSPSDGPVDVGGEALGDVLHRQPACIARCAPDDDVIFATGHYREEIWD